MYYDYGYGWGGPVFGGGGRFHHRFDRGFHPGFAFHGNGAHFAGRNFGHVGGVGVGQFGGGHFAGANVGHAGASAAASSAAVISPAETSATWAASAVARASSATVISPARKPSAYVGAASAAALAKAAQCAAASAAGTWAALAAATSAAAGISVNTPFALWFAFGRPSAARFRLEKLLPGSGNHLG